MDRLESLFERCRADPAAHSGGPAFVIDPAADPDEQLVGILAVFATAREDRVEVYRGSRCEATVERSDVLDLFVDVEMTVGAGQPFVLPGDPQDAFVELACERSDCDRRLYVTFYVPHAPPACPDHPAACTRPVR